MINNVRFILQHTTQVKTKSQVFRPGETAAQNPLLLFCHQNSV